MSRDDDAASADWPRRSPSPVVAALLSAMGLPLGQWYAGDVRRCLLIWLLSCGASYGILAVLASPLPVGGIGIAAAGEAPPLVDPRLSAFGPVVVPDDHWIVLGDNPRLAKDSRIIGPVAFADYLGIARRLIWSRERITPNRASPDHVVPGRIRWERIGRGL